MVSKESCKRGAVAAAGLLMMVGVPLVAAESFSFLSDATVTSNLVFGAGATLDVAEGVTATALGTLALGENGAGDLSKTGAGTFELATVAINGKANGGDAASLDVQNGTFAFSAQDGVASSFGDGMTIGETGVLEVRRGTAAAGALALGGGRLNVSGGSLTARNATGAATVSVSGGGVLAITDSFTASSVLTENDGTRIDLTDGGVLATKNMTAASGAEFALHVNGGVFKSLQSVYADAVSGGIASVGEKGMTIDLTDSYAWGPQWKMNIAPEPGVTDGGVDIVNTSATGDDLSMRIRFMDDCALSVKGGIRLNNVEAMLLGESYPVAFKVGDCAGVRAAVSPTVTVDELTYTGRNGYLVLGVNASNEASMLVAKKFTAPSGCLRVKFFGTDTTTAKYPTGTADILKIPASAPFSLASLSEAQNRSGYTFTFTARVEGSWRIISVTGTAQSGATLNPHETDSWMTGTTPWLLNNTIYFYSGGTRTVNAMMLLNPASYRRNSMLSVPEDVTLSLAGGSQQMQGGFVKFGDGTLTFGGDSAYVFCHYFNKLEPIVSGITQANLVVTNSSGVSARTHDASLTVAAGTLKVGNGTDSPVVTVDRAELDIGTATTSSAGTERDAAMVMESGVLSVQNDALVVGRTHGIVATQSHTPLVSSFTQNGGTVTVHSAGVAIDETAKSSMDARLVVNGGAFECRRELRLGMIGTSAAAESTATIEMNGGTRDIGEEAAVRGVEGRLLAGTNSSAKLSTVFTINGGTVTLHTGALFAASGSHTVNLNEGGTIEMKSGSFAANSGATASTINWNGGVLKFCGANTLSGFKTVNIGAKDAILDISEAGTTSWFNQSLTGEGKLVVRGSGYQRGVQVYGSYDGCGGIVVERGGNVMLRDDPTVSSFPVLVKDGGALTSYYTTDCPLVTFGEAETDVTTLLDYDINNNYSNLRVNGTLTVNGTVYIGCRETTNGRLTLRKGTFTFLRAPKGQIDVSKFQIHPDLLARGAVAEVFLNDEASATYDYLQATCTADPSEYVWTAGTSGDWSVDANWSIPPPGEPDDSIVFPATLAEDITVSTTTNARMRSISQNAAQTVTLSGPVRLTYGARYDIAEPDGVLEINGPLSTVTQVTSARTSGAGTLRLNGQVSGDSKFVVNSGRVEGAPEMFGSTAMNLANTTLRFTESGTFTGSIVHETANATGVGVEVVEGKTVYVTGALNNSSALQKLGPGKVVFCRTGTKASVTNLVGKTQKAVDTLPWSNGTNGDVPNGPQLGVYAGEIAFDGDKNTKYTVVGGVRVGTHPVLDGTGGAYDATLSVYGGTLTVDSLSVNRFTGNNIYDRPGDLGLTRSPRGIVNVYGGTLRVNAEFIMGLNPKKDCCAQSELNVYGGLFEVNGAGAPASFGIGYRASANVASSPEDLSSTINLYGGTIRRTAPDEISFGAYDDGYTYIPYITLNMQGGHFDAPASTLNLMRKNAKVRVNLCGGVLDILSFTQGKSIGSSTGSSLDFHFSGGTYRPNAESSSFPPKTMTSFTVGEGGAKFDLCESNALTLNQALTTAPGVAQDGGIALTATGDAVLTLNVANAFNGPITVNGGTIRPAVEGAASCAEGVVVNGAGVFDANGMDFTFGYLKGNGGTYVNGTVTVTGYVEPGALGLNVQNLVFGGGATLRCPVSGGAEGGWSAPCLKVSGIVSAQGGVTVDIGGSESSPLPIGTRVKVVEIAAGGSFPSIRVVGVCERRSSIALSRVVGANGVTEVWAEVVPLGTVLHLR